MEYDKLKHYLFLFLLVFNVVNLIYLKLLYALISGGGNPANKYWCSAHFSYENWLVPITQMAWSASMLVYICNKRHHKGLGLSSE